MRSYSHVTPRYVFDRVGEMISLRFDPNAPWLAKRLVRILEARLEPTNRGLEWGAGRSTIWFAKRVAHLVSIEHDEWWAETVRKRIGVEGIGDRVTLHCLPYGESEQGELSAASPYVCVVDGLAPESLDFCLVDGACRDHCALAILPKLKVGGMLIIDDIQRYFPRSAKSRAPCARGLEDGFASESWEDVARIISEWPCTWTTNGVRDTALWTKV